jgi:hypothetical protein
MANGLAGRGTDGGVEFSSWSRMLAETNDLFPRFLGQAYAMAGDSERAVHWISVAVDRGFINYPYLARHDPYLRRLADHTPYAELLDRVRRQWEAFEP